MREPLHSIVASRAETLILSGEWPQGSQLPPERELCRTFSVSRATLRQALAELENRRLITRRQGRGTFVARPRLAADVSRFFTIAAALRANGMELGTEVLGVGVIEASRQESEALGLLPGDPVVRLERLRRVADEPLLLEMSHLPGERFPGLEDADFTHRSLYAVLSEDHGCRVRSAVETFEPVVTTKAESGLLGVPTHAPALLIRRTASDQDGRVVEHSQALLRGDRCNFLLRRRIERYDDDPAAGEPEAGTSDGSYAL
jgi:GntR family transcriptional regulator